MEDFSAIMSRPYEQSGESNKIIIDQALLDEFNLLIKFSGLSRSDFFSPFFPLHREIASKVVEYLISCDTVDKLKAVAAHGRDHINAYLFNYAFSIAILNRRDTRDMRPLSPAETFPDKFFIADVFSRAIEEISVVPKGSRKPIIVDVPKNVTEKYPETRMEYFRHDLGLNVCYYFWHLTHPFESTDRKIVDIDRRGELWYYFHQQIIARYNAERYCNGLMPAVPFSNFELCIEDGYFPKMCTQYMEHSWAPRFDNSYLGDLHRPHEGLVVNKSKFQRWIDRICNAIEIGHVIDEEGKLIQLNNDNGVDIIGNILQSSILSPNRQFYGDICNIGHAFISYCHDPYNLSLQSYGVMGEPSTCARDTLFYRWYSSLIRIVQLHKSQLPTYTKKELGFDNVIINSLRTENIKSGTQNQLMTSWDYSDFNLRNGLNFVPDADVYARIKHLQYEDFQYVFDIQNDNSIKQTGTVRIFLSQKYNIRDRELMFEELRMSMIQLDCFPVTLIPGNNHIVRKSKESSVTIPSINIFEPLKVRQKIASNTNDSSSFCLTGWPDHLLIPKGSKEGAKFILFAMISNDTPVDEKPAASGKCTSASTYSNLPNQKYPDKRSCGFPFDRNAPLHVLSVKSFMLPNMKIVDQDIKFIEK